MLNNTEVHLMALRLDRERELKLHVEESRSLRELERQPARQQDPKRGVLGLVWHVASGVLQGRWLETERRRSERDAGAVPAGTLATECR